MARRPWRADRAVHATPPLFAGEFFPSIGRIHYAGPDSDDPLAFHYYNAEEVVYGRPMREW